MKTVVPRRKTILFVLIGVALCMMQNALVRAQSLDLSFRAPVPLDAADIDFVFEQPDRKLILSGDDDLYFGAQRMGRVVRLSAGGAVDRTFQPNFDGELDAIAMYRNGGYLASVYGQLAVLDRSGKVLNWLSIYSVSKIIVLPDFSFLVIRNGTVYKYNSSYGLDYSFGWGGYVDIDGDAYDIALQRDKIIIVGDFEAVNGNEIYYLARVNADGSFDATFNTGDGPDEQIGSVSVQRDGKILLGNTELDWFDDTYTGGSVVRLNSDGSIDESFQTGWFGYVGEVVERAGKVYIFSWNEYGLFRVNADGSYDASYSTIWFDDEDIIVKVLGNGETLAANDFDHGGDFGINKFYSNGKIVPTFKPVLGERGYIYTIEKAGSKLLVTGEFVRLNNVPTRNVGMLTSSGSVDPIFRNMEDLDWIYSAKAFSDGSVLVRSSGQGIVKLRSNGRWDDDFNFYDSWPIYSWSVESFDIDARDRILVASYYGHGRLNSDGSLDDSYAVGYIDNYIGYWTDVEALANGKTMFGGYFWYYNSNYREQIVRLNSDGSLDESFNAGSATNYLLRQITATRDGGSFVTGYFWNWNGYGASGFAKLREDGSYDETFMANFHASNPYPWYYSLTWAVAPLQDGVALYNYSWNDYSWRLRKYNAEGVLASYEETVPEAVNYFEWVEDLYSPDANTLYVASNTWLDNGQQLSLVRIKYPTVATAASGRQAVSASYKVFPNPTSDFISFDTDKPATLSVHSMDGQIRLQSQVRSAEDKLDIRGLKPGRYIVSMNVDGKITTEHLIID